MDTIQLRSYHVDPRDGGNPLLITALSPEHAAERALSVNNAGMVFVRVDGEWREFRRQQYSKAA